MNISLLAEATSAGVGTHVIQLANGLLALNHKVDLGYSRLRMDGPFRDGVHFLSLRPGFTSYEVDIQRNPHLSDLSVMRTIRSRLRVVGSPDIVHCHSTKAGLVGRLAVASTGARVVYTPHAFLTLDPRLNSTRRWIVSRMELALSVFGDAVIAVSMEEKAHAAAIGIPPSKVFLVPNGVSLELSTGALTLRNRLRTAAGLQDDDLCVGFVGRLFPQKAPANLLRAIALLGDNRCPKLFLAIVGSGPLLPELQALSRTLGIEDQVIWLGEREGRTAMTAFDLFVLPSDYEGLPYVVLEAMSCGLPVISTAVGGVNLLIKENQNGHIVPVGRPDLLAHAISSILNSPEKRKSMGLRSAMFVKDFSLEGMVNKTVKVYETVLQRSNAIHSEVVPSLSPGPHKIRRSI